MDIKDNKFNKSKAFTNNKAIKAAYWERINLREVETEVETKTITEQGSVMGIVIPLDTISIAL